MLKKFYKTIKGIQKRWKQKAKSRRCVELACATGTKPDLSRLLERGWCNLSGVSDTNFVQYIKEKYLLSDDIFLPCEGNLSWPIMDDQIRNILCNTTFRAFITEYFYCAYRKIPILQMIPTITVTKPNITQEYYKHEVHGFPGIWHSDYSTEMGVHIPINDITTQTTYTKYVETSNRVALEQDGLSLNDSYIKKIYGPNCLAQCLSKSGEVLIMDTTGLHRAEISKGLRIMVQFKFTVGNDPLIFNIENLKYKKSIDRLKRNHKKFEILKKIIKSDLDYIKSNTFDDMIEIIGRSEDTLEAYLK